METANCIATNLEMPYLVLPRHQDPHKSYSRFDPEIADHGSRDQELTTESTERPRKRIRINIPLSVSVWYHRRLPISRIVNAC